MRGVDNVPVSRRGSAPASYPLSHDRPTPLSRRGLHGRLPRLALVQLLALVAAGAGVAGPAGLLVSAVVAGGLGWLVLRRADWLEGSELVVRRVRTRRVDLSTAERARLRSVPAGDHRVLELVVSDADGRTAAVPVWRTRSPRGVDVWACSDLAARLVRAPEPLRALLSAQGEAVRQGVRPTPLDRWVPHEAHWLPESAPTSAPRADRLPSRAEVAGSASGVPRGSRRTGPGRTSPTGSR